MKLTYRIVIQTSLVLLVLFAVWATIFYFIIIDEINDETDDALEDYSELIITRALAGEELPSKDSGTNNNYYIKEVAEEYATANQNIKYSSEMIYIESKKETEPARILRCIFRNKDNRYYELTVLFPTVEKKDLAETILIWIVILYLMLLLVIVVIDAWILHRSFKPLRRILSWLDKFSVNKVPEPLDNETNITEFKRLNNAVVRSAERNINAYNQQNRFIGHASHELQTPLAISQNRLEMLLNDPDLTEKQLENVMKAKQSLTHIIKLNRTLLLLTKIDNNQFPDEEIIHINELIRRYISDYSEIYETLNIQVSIEDEAVLSVKMNETLASILVSNLLRNAFVHNRKENGVIDIRISSSSLSIENTGAPHPLDTEKIFNYFYQDQKQKDSMGLGLSLVKAIVKLNNFHLSYSYAEEKHRFRLSFTSPAVES